MLPEPKEERMGLIPLVDLSGVDPQSAQNSEALERAAKEILEAFSTVGFVYLSNHGIPRTQIEEARKKSDEFFSLPTGVKSAYTRKGDSNHGWVALEMEMLGKKRLNAARGAGDYKEAYNATPNADLEWPDREVGGFKDGIMRLFDSCVQLTNTLLTLISIGLQLEDKEFLHRTHNMKSKKNSTTLRCLHYPALTDDTELKAGQVRCGEHADYGTVTLLFQDPLGGLEVMNRQGEYQPATPVEGAVLVNIGDMMQRWTADKLVSTKHRVLVPAEEVLKRSVRQSMAFFVQPDDDCVITCLDGSAKYPPITSLEFLQEKFSATY